MTDPELDRIRTDLQHARSDAGGVVQSQLDQVTTALQTLDERDDDPRPDRVESIRDELKRLEDDAAGDTRTRIRDARERLRAFEERLPED